MESNGVASKIHASGTTAELLIAAGKAHWVTEREELIEAKGYVPCSLGFKLFVFRGTDLSL